MRVQETRHGYLLTKFILENSLKKTQRIAFIPQKKSSTFVELFFFMIC